jgi:hypothetical protein
VCVADETYKGFFVVTVVLLQLPLGRYISKLLHYSIPVKNDGYWPTSISAPKSIPPLLSTVPSFSNATEQRSSQDAGLDRKAQTEREFNEKHVSRPSSHLSFAN